MVLKSNYFLHQVSDEMSSDLKTEQLSSMNYELRCKCPPCHELIKELAVFSSDDLLQVIHLMVFYADLIRSAAKHTEGVRRLINGLCCILLTALSIL